MKLTAKQTKALDYLEDKLTTQVLYGGAAGGGKSVLGAYWLLKMAFKYPGTRWMMGRSELKTLKKTTLNSFFEVCKIMGMKSGVHYKFNQQDGIIYIPNESQIVLADLYQYPSDPDFDSLGSLEITGAFIDECNQLTEKAKNIVKSRIRYKLDDYGLLPKMLMTCNPAKNWVYYEFYQPHRQGSMPVGKQFIQALVSDNNFISSHYIDNLKTLDKQSRERLLLGNWEYDDDPAALISYEMILEAFTNDDERLGGNRYITADVARFGKDKTVIGLWDGYRVRLYTYKGLSVVQTAFKIQELQKAYDVNGYNTVVDEDGVGGGVVDLLKPSIRGFVNNARPLPNPETKKDDNFVNLKSQCYFRLADRINNKGLYIDCNDVEVKATIIQELEQVKQFNMDKDAKRQVMPKDKVKELIGRSPDYADTLMMREYFDLAPKYSWVAF